MNLKIEDTLIGYTSKLDDPRAPYNQKHKFIDIVTITILGTLCGADSWNEIEEWGEANEEWLEKFLDLPGIYIPEFNNKTKINIVEDMDDAYQITDVGSLPVITGDSVSEDAVASSLQEYTVTGGVTTFVNDYLTVEEKKGE